MASMKLVMPCANWAFRFSTRLARSSSYVGSGTSRPAADQFSRNTRQGATLVVVDNAARRVRRVPVDPRQFQSKAVQNCAVPSGTSNRRRVVRDYRVEVLFCGQPPLRHLVFRPAPPGDPLARPQLFSLPDQTLLKLGNGRHARHVHVPPSPATDVRVGIVETRHHETAPEIQHLRGPIRLQQLVSTQRHDLLIEHRHGGVDGQKVIRSENRSVVDHQVHRLLCRPRQCSRQQAGNCDQSRNPESPHAVTPPPADASFNTSASFRYAMDRFSWRICFASS